jgi:hypothetical protein
MKREIIREIQEVVAQSGATLEIVAGGKHRHIVINGRRAAILPYSLKGDGGNGRANTLAHVRRALRRSQ